MLEVIRGYIGCAILLVSVYFFGAILFPNRIKNKKHYDVCVFIIGSIIHTTIFFLFDNTLKTILLCINFIMMFKHIFNINYGKSSFVTIIYTILALIPDVLTMVIFIYIFNVSKNAYYIEYAGGILCSISVSILMILLTYIIRKPLRKLVNYNLSTNKKIILIALLTLVSLAIFFYNIISKFEFNNDILGYLLVILTLIVILFYLFKQKIDNETILKKYDELLDIMKTYENDIEEQRTMIHETRNELMTIKSKINDKAKEAEIIKYIDSIIGDKISSSISKYGKFKYLPSNGIKGFFYYKFMEAERRNIKVSVNISKRIENSFLGSLDTKEFKDLVRIIGVYLDNAIEASESSKDKKLGIEIYMIKENIEIIISNTFDNEINIEKIGKERFTTKGKNHGHGLLLVKHILNNSTIFESNREIVKNLYIQKLKIKNNK